MNLNTDNGELGDEFFKMFLSIDLRTVPSPEESVGQGDKFLGVVTNKMILRAHILIQKLDVELAETAKFDVEKRAKIIFFMGECSRIFWKFLFTEFQFIDGLKGHSLSFRKGWVLVAVKDEVKSERCSNQN